MVHYFDRQVNWGCISARHLLNDIARSLYGLLSPLTSSMLAPCVGAMSKSLNVTQPFQMNMMVSIYLLG